MHDHLFNTTGEYDTLHIKFPEIFHPFLLKAPQFFLVNIVAYTIHVLMNESCSQENSPVLFFRRPS